MAWDYEGYWNTVLGASRSADTLVEEFELDRADRRGLDEWLGQAEAEAWRAGGEGGPLPAEWADHHARALEEICRNVRSDSGIPWGQGPHLIDPNIPSQRRKD